MCDRFRCEFAWRLVSPFVTRRIWFRRIWFRRVSFRRRSPKVSYDDARIVVI